MKTSFQRDVPQKITINIVSVPLFQCLRCIMLPQFCVHFDWWENLSNDPEHFNINLAKWHLWPHAKYFFIFTPTDFGHKPLILFSLCRRHGLLLLQVLNHSILFHHHLKYTTQEDVRTNQVFNNRKDIYTLTGNGYILGENCDFSDVYHVQ